MLGYINKKNTEYKQFIITVTSRIKHAKII